MGWRASNARNQSDRPAWQPLLLFTDDLVDKLAQRFATMPEHLRPIVWQHATDPQHGQFREWLERRLRSLEKPVLAGFLSRLRAEQLYTQAVAELAIAHVVDQPGYIVEYEPDIDGLTPDLRVTDPTGRHLLVEVWRRGLPQRTVKRNAGWAQMARAIQRIPVPVAIAVEAAHADAIDPPDDAARARTVTVLRRWLTERQRSKERQALQGRQAPQGRLWLPERQWLPERWLSERWLPERQSLSEQLWLPERQRPPERQRLPEDNNDVLIVDDHRFRVVGTTTSGRTELLPVFDGVSLRRDDVVHAIEAKVKKYRQIANRHDTPFLVVLGGDDGAVMTRPLVEDILASHNTLSVTIPPWGVGVIDSGPIDVRRTDAPPIFDPAMSGIGWLDIRDGAQARVELIWHNPRADRPIQAMDPDAET